MRQILANNPGACDQSSLTDSSDSFHPSRKLSSADSRLKHRIDSEVCNVENTRLSMKIDAMCLLVQRAHLNISSWFDQVAPFSPEMP